MNKVFTFLFMMVAISTLAFALAFLLGLLVRAFYSNYTIDTAFWCAIGTGIGCGPINAMIITFNS
jgi:hypothetical protein